MQRVRQSDYIIHACSCSFVIHFLFYAVYKSSNHIPIATGVLLTYKSTPVISGYKYDRYACYLSFSMSTTEQSSSRVLQMINSVSEDRNIASSLPLECDSIRIS